MSANNPEIRALTLDEIDAVSGGASVTLWKGFGVQVDFTYNNKNNGCNLSATSTSTGQSAVHYSYPGDPGR